MGVDEIFSRADKKERYDGEAKKAYGVTQLKRQTTGICGLPGEHSRGVAMDKIRWAGLAEDDAQAGKALDAIVGGTYAYDERRSLRIVRRDDRGMKKYVFSVVKS